MQNECGHPDLSRADLREILEEKIALEGDSVVKAMLQSIVLKQSIGGV